jgi:uncharacterized protein (UPF0335 family)
MTEKEIIEKLNTLFKEDNIEFGIFEFEVDNKVLRRIIRKSKFNNFKLVEPDNTLNTYGTEAFNLIVNVTNQRLELERM